MSADPRTAQLEALQLALAGVWSIERELGRGGMGTVYLGRDVALERPVAIKVLDPALSGDPAQRERFLREARTGARLTHPHIVPIYAVEETADTVIIVMGLVDGESLAARIQREGPLDDADARRLLTALAQALGYAHAMGILHRDVTLDNVLLDRRSGRPMLADFGIAAEISDPAAGPLLGTPAYLAPELIQGSAPSVASDLYAFGVLGWAVLAGRLPFHAEEQGALLLQHLTMEVPSLSSAAPGATATLVRAIEACLRKEPGERPASAEAWLPVDGGHRAVARTGPLEEWVDSWQQVRAFYGMGLSLAAVLAFAGDRILGLTAFAELTLVFGIPTALLLVHRLVLGRLLRRAIGAGYRLEDLRLGLQRKTRRDALDRGIPARGWSRVARAVVIAPFGFVALLFLFGILHTLSDRYFVGLVWIWHGPLRLLMNSMATLLPVAGLCVFTSLGASVLLGKRTTRTGRLIQRLRARWWNSPMGALGYWMAGGRRTTALQPEHTLHRPTELVIDLAIEDLWQALPGESRARTAALPATAHALRERVARLRDLRQQVAMALRHSPELQPLADELATRLTAGLTAMERLRLGVMRLGEAATDEDVVTIPLAAARAMDRELRDLIDRHARLPAPRLPAITPYPTPA